MAKTAIPEATRGTYFNVDPSICTIVDDPDHPLYQKRADVPPTEEMIQSVKMYGVIEPVILRPNGDEYEVVVGRRRVRAAQVVNLRAGKTAVLVKAIIHRGTDAELALIALAENNNRRDSDPVEQAHEVTHAMRFGASVVSVAAAIGVSRQTVENRLKLLDVTPEIQAEVRTGKLPVTVAHELARLPRAKQTEAHAAVKSLGHHNKVKAHVDAVKRGATPLEAHAAVNAAGVPVNPTLLKRLVEKLRKHQDPTMQKVADCLAYASTGQRTPWLTQIFKDASIPEGAK